MKFLSCRHYGTSPTKKQTLIKIVLPKIYYGRNLTSPFSVLQTALCKLPLGTTSVCLSTPDIAMKVKCTIREQYEL